MQMQRKIGCSFRISNINGNDTESMISNALKFEHIDKWAYVLHDKEYYTQYDIDALRFGMQRNWADGFPEKNQYSSMDEYIADRMKSGPQIGDKKPEYWHIVLLTDEKITDGDLLRLFGISKNSIMPFTYQIEVADAISSILGEDEVSVMAGRHQYSDSEVKSNFDFRAYIAEAEKCADWEMIKSHFHLSMEISMIAISFIIALVFWLISRNANPWLFSMVIGGIGILYLAANINAKIIGKRQSRFVPGLPFISGIHFLVAGLVSPVKLLALLCLGDFTIWIVVYAWYKAKFK